LTSNLISCRILVVDDFEPWRRYVCSRLQEHPGMQVVGEAANGFDAVQKADELKPDLVLLDIQLPDINGIEVSSRIGHAIPDTKVLFATLNNDPEWARAALSNGAYGLLLKAEAATELLPAIEMVLRGEKFVSKRVKP